MKYILLVMTILQIKTFYGSLQGIFSTHEQDVDKLNNAVADIDAMANNNKEFVNIFMLVIMLGYALFLTIYYALAGIYVNQIIFSVISCLFTVRAWKGMGKSAKWFDTRDNELIEKTFISRIISAIYLSYIYYLVYFIVANWN